MKYFTYVLLSLKNGDIYVGSTEDINNRIGRHNAGKVRSTKANKPWKLLEYHGFDSRSEAFKYERFLKSHQQKDIIREKYNLK
jgi:putative endonuclease